MDLLDKYVKLPYAITVVRDDCGGQSCYLASHPELRGCMAQGETPQDAVDSLAEARREYIAALLEDGLAVPTPKEVTPHTGFTVLYQGVSMPASDFGGVPQRGVLSLNMAAVDAGVATVVEQVVSGQRGTAAHGNGLMLAV